MKRNSNGGFALLLLLVIMVALCVIMTAATQAVFRIREQNKLLARSIERKALQLSAPQKTEDAPGKR